MKKTIAILLKRLSEKGILKHVVCPSAKLSLRELYNDIPNPIEIIDERSAGYVATGMCAETDTPIVVWCTDNDSYRNLTSALTEAFYRKLPILVVALECRHLIDQTINPYDTIRYYVNNTQYNRIGTQQEIDSAIKFLFAEVKGPVYLSVGEYRDAVVEEHIEPSRVDVSTLAKMIPTDACVHIGSDVTCNSKNIYDIIYRYDHCTKDGNLSMLIGSAVVAESQLHVGIFSQEEIAYDLNMLGNRHVANNIIVVCISNNNQPNAIYDVAHRFAWECKKVSSEELGALNNYFGIGDRPKYIEVEL